jgi:hypothetical protein
MIYQPLLSLTLTDVANATEQNKSQAISYFDERFILCRNLIRISFLEG